MSSPSFYVYKKNPLCYHFGKCKQKRGAFLEKLEKRISVRLGLPTYEKLDHMGKSYGMSVNSIVSFIVGQWFDTNYEFKEKMKDKMIESFSGDSMNQSLEKVLTDPAYLNLLKEMMQEKEMIQGEEKK